MTKIALERLQKIIAAAGVASRRKAEELITSGAVSVNGKVVTELGTKADPAHDHIRVMGKLLHGAERNLYLLLNKPKGYVTTVSDPEHRPTVMDLLRGVHARVYPVGRLDYASEGLILLTNDGALAHKLMHASSHVPKTYLAKVSGRPEEALIEKLRGGISIAAEASGGRRVRTAPARIELIREAENPWYEVTLIEGKNRQIRKMFEEIGHHVEKIRRVRYGPLQLDVEPGKFRELTLREVALLKSAAQGHGGDGRAGDLSGPANKQFQRSERTRFTGTRLTGKRLPAGKRSDGGTGEKSVGKKPAAKKSKSVKTPNKARAKRL